MAARAYWKGHLRLSLVTIGVELFTAVNRTSKLSFHQIHKTSEKRVRYQKVAPGVGPVEADEIVRGYEIDKDNYVLIEPEELEQVKLESKHTIDLIQFVDQCEIDPRYFDKPYYVVPDESEVALEGFSVIREALRESKKVALGQMAARGRDYVVAIRPCGQGLLLETLRYEDEIRESDKAFAAIDDVDVNDDMLDLAGELIKRKSAPFDPGAFKSQFVQAVRDLIAAKRKTGKVATASDDELPVGGDNVIDLMEALKKSVARNRKKTTHKKTAPRKTTTKSATKKATAKKAAAKTTAKRKAG